MDQSAPVPSRREEVSIGCDGHRHTITIINRRYTRWRCTQKRCRARLRTGEQRLYHLADGLTGRLVRTEFETHEGRVIRSEEE